MPNPCRINGILFESQAAAGRHFGVTRASICKAINLGQHDNVQRFKRKGKGNCKPFKYGSFEAPSVTEAARMLGISFDYLRKLISPRSTDKQREILIGKIMQHERLKK